MANATLGSCSLRSRSARRHPRGRPRNAPGLTAKAVASTGHLVRVHPRSGRRHRGDNRPGERAVAAARPAKHDAQGARYAGRSGGDRGAHTPRHQRQRHAAVLDRPLRGSDRHLRSRTAGSRRRPRTVQRHSVGRFVLLSRIDTKIDPQTPSRFGRSTTRMVLRALARLRIFSGTDATAVRCVACPLTGASDRSTGSVGAR
jgi:hypothetical protein